MKDPKHIQELLELIKEIWLRDPDLRFNQLLYNLQYGYSYKNEGVGQVKEIGPDGFTRTLNFPQFSGESSLPLVAGRSLHSRR